MLVDDLYDNGNAVRAATAIEDLVPTFRTALMLIDNAKRVGNPNLAFNRLTEGTKKDQVQTCIFQITAAMRGPRFAVTDTVYMCLVPACPEVRDVVAVVLGACTPLTVRPESGITNEYGMDELPLS